MKIEKFKKLKNGIYELQLDNFDKILTYEEVILKYELLINKDVTNKTLKEIEELNKYYQCYYKALNLINKKAYTKLELSKKLKEEKQDDIDKVISLLENQGYINDKVYANAFLNNKIQSTNYGPNRIRKELSDKGIKEDIIEDALINYTSEIEEEKIEKLIKKYINSNHNKSNNYMKIKIKNDLTYQGFNTMIIDEIINNIKFKDDTNIREKEYNKLKNKLQKKYDKQELEYRIKEKMNQKGFY